MSEKCVMVSISPENAGGIFLNQLDYLLFSRQITQAREHPMKVYFYVTEPMGVVMGEGRIVQVLSKQKTADVAKRAWIAPDEIADTLRTSPYIYRLTCVKEYDAWKEPKEYGVESPRYFAYCDEVRRRKPKAVKKKKAVHPKAENKPLNLLKKVKL